MADILFLPGLWNDGDATLELQEFLEEKGHRFHTPRIPEDRRIKKKIHAVETYLLNERFEAPPVLIGESTGGLLAQLVAAKVEVGPLILLNSSSPSGSMADALRSSGTGARILCSSPPAAAKPLPDWRSSCVALISDALFHPSRLAVAPGTLNAPVLVISGGLDRIASSRTAVRLYRRYARAEFHAFAEQGHCLLSGDGGERVFQAMSDWLAALDFYPETSPAEERSIPQAKHSHHERHQLHPAAKSLSASKRARLDSVSLDAGRIRRSAHENAAADGGAVLPR